MNAHLCFIVLHLPLLAVCACSCWRTRHMGRSQLLPRTHRAVCAQHLDAIPSLPPCWQLPTVELGYVFTAGRLLLFVWNRQIGIPQVEQAA